MVVQKRVTTTMRRVIKKYGNRCSIYQPVEITNELGESIFTYNLLYQDVPIIYRIRRITNPRSSSAGIYVEEFLEASVIGPDNLSAPFTVEPGYRVYLNGETYRVLSVTSLGYNWLRLTLSKE